MIEFMELHSIMSTDHHGGMKIDSTQTTMTQIYNKLYNKKEKTSYHYFYVLILVQRMIRSNMTFY